MNRREAMLGVLALGACATGTGGEPRFQSERLSVVVRGEGPDIVLIPGLSCPRDVWGGLADALTPHYRLHLAQLTGFGEASPSPEGPLFEPAAQELLRYIQEQGLNRPALIGHSMGGALALRVSILAPQRLGRVMVVDALPFFSVLVSPTATPDSMAEQADALSAQMRGMDDATFLALQQRTMATLVKRTEDQARAVAWSIASHRPTVAQMMRDVMTTDLRPQLPAIAIPVTVLYAWDASMAFPAAGADFLYTINYAGLQGVRLVRVDDALHFIMLDQPGRFEAEVRAFLG
ncbi:MAG: alpha/beta hydrolase [Alphaproteobacteria bacterium]|nr:alpha/beta hydrolase [Alphaproteobacteria bacterium]